MNKNTDKVKIEYSRHMLVYPKRCQALKFAEGPVAQWLERSAHNRLVGGSSPSGPTKHLNWETLGISAKQSHSPCNQGENRTLNSQSLYIKSPQLTVLTHLSDSTLLSYALECRNMILNPIAQTQQNRR